MINSEFSRLSADKGFAACYFLPPTIVETSSNKLISDPRSAMLDVHTVIILIMPYAPSCEDSGNEGVISPYYLVSHYAFNAAKSLARMLIDEGYNAISNVQLPLKNLLEMHGIGKRGKNSLIAIDSLGSAFHVQSILTNAVFDYSSTGASSSSFASRCKACKRCIDACPTGAILPFGKIDIARCLRAISEMDTIPQEYEKKLGNRILGCDVCQNVCPANRFKNQGNSLNVNLKKLLNGEIDDLKSIIGTNYARVNKLRKKAAVVAANLHRYDLLEDLKRVSALDDPKVSQAALRAIDRLENEL